MLAKATIEKVARVARLELNDEEKEKFSYDLGDILSAFGTLDAADVSGVEPAFQPVEVKDVLRDDVAEPSLSQEEALANAGHKENGYFKEPKAM